MEFETGKTNIKVIGTGGAGNNMVGWLYNKGVQGAEILACNTDKQHLDMINADHKFIIGKDVTRGLGCGGYPQKGEESAKESLQEIKGTLRGADMVFVCAGMGGGTGTGSAPIIAKTAKETGAIVVGTVTMPFKIERARVDKAEHGLRCLREVADTVIVIDNNRLVKIAGSLPVKQAFAVANELVATMIKGIVETIAVPSLVNLDYADVQSIMADGGVAVIGVGSSDTTDKVEEAVKSALNNPLLEVNYEGAVGALINIVGGPDMTLDDINKVGELVTETLEQDANVVWGARINEDMTGKISVMTIITGIKSPFVLGKVEQPKDTVTEVVEIEEELGLQIVNS